MKFRRAHARRFVAGVVALTITVAGCSTSSTPSTTAPRVPVPELPGDINKIPFKFQELAALGNVQIVVTAVTNNSTKTDTARDRTVDVTLIIRNGAFTDLMVRPDSFRLYTSNLNSVLPANNPFTEAYKSNTRHTVTLSFPITGGLLGVALVFNSAGYGDRVMSGQFLLDPNISFATS